jgi:GNAT superfamily N-acetyltransferase
MVRSARFGRIVGRWRGDSRLWCEGTLRPAAPYTLVVIRIERMTQEGWERVRAVRLSALGDAPDAFATTLAEDLAHPPEEWQARLASPSAATFLASVGGEDIGLVTGAEYRGRVGSAGLFGMWVAPLARGTGAADRLVEAVVLWARSEQYERVLLEVSDGNAPALGLYTRMGFALTGKTGTLPEPRTHIRELEMAFEL